MFGVFFDSFGRKPLKNVETFLNSNCTCWTYNTRQIQDVTSDRVKSCVMFCHNFVRNKGIDDFLNIFRGSTMENDKLCDNFYLISRPQLHKYNKYIILKKYHD